MYRRVVMSGAPEERIFISLALAPGTYGLRTRLANLDPTGHFILDSPRADLHVIGDQSFDALVAPRHRFEQVHTALDHATATVARG